MARKEAGWNELALWLSLRGCRANYDSMEAWGINWKNRRSGYFRFS